MRKSLTIRNLETVKYVVKYLTKTITCMRIADYINDTGHDGTTVHVACLMV